MPLTAELSGGEQQEAAITRAAVRKPETFSFPMFFSSPSCQNKRMDGAFCLQVAKQGAGTDGDYCLA